MGDVKRGHILIVDDEQNALRVLSAILKEDGHTVREAMDYNGALNIVNRHDIDVVITDMKMPDRDGMQLFEYISENHPDIPVIFLTAYGTVDSAVHAITQGAFYYFIKPPDYAKLKGILARALEQRLLKREIESLKSRLGLEEHEGRIIGKATALVKIFETINAVKDSISSVLICGETGTGKELIARSLHFQSTRKGKPFVAVNCAAMPSGLLESELFGYEKGAFTGADRSHAGLLESAQDGTIFLDEITEMSTGLQAKLLRFMQNGEIRRLGGHTTHNVTVRVVAAANRNIDEEIQKGTFRSDLLYRFVVRLHIPPLREHKEDLPQLVESLLKKLGYPAVRVSDDVMEMLIAYDWPGNVRELQNVLQQTILLSPFGLIQPENLPERFRQKRTDPCPALMPLEGAERGQILNGLNAMAWNISRTAQLLGIDRKTLRSKMQRYGLMKDGPPANHP